MKFGINVNRTWSPSKEKKQTMRKRKISNSNNKSAKRRVPKTQEKKRN
jgi:hypothetical protein